MYTSVSKENKDHYLHRDGMNCGHDALPWRLRNCIFLDLRELPVVGFHIMSKRGIGRGNWRSHSTASMKKSHETFSRATNQRIKIDPEKTTLTQAGLLGESRCHSISTSDVWLFLRRCRQTPVYSRQPPRTDPRHESARVHFSEPVSFLSFLMGRKMGDSKAAASPECPV